MDFGHVVAYMVLQHEMLQWYGEFNKVRTAFFKNHGVFDGVVPASKGIGGAMPQARRSLRASGHEDIWRVRRSPRTFRPSSAGAELRKLIQPCRR
jgi:hypothetical protein